MSSDTIDLDRHYTIADLDELPRDGSRYELADGQLIVSPFARRRHGVGVIELARALEAVCPPELYVFSNPINVDDPDATHVEPDLTVVRRSFRDVENGDLPLLAVEVRSPSTAGRDAVLKRRAYARLGIPSYWLLDADAPSLRVLELVEDDYAEVAFGEGATAVTVSRPFPVTIVPDTLFA